MTPAPPLREGSRIGTHVIPVAAGTVTRRQLLAAGGASALAAAGLAWAQSGAGGPGVFGLSAPAHLRRSAYLPLVGEELRVAGAGTTLRLTAGDDLRSPALAGRDDAFALTLRGRATSPLEQGTHTLRHPALGRFELFMVPSGNTRYRVVVNRARSG